MSLRSRYQPDLVWTGSEFEENVEVRVEDGMIADVVRYKEGELCAAEEWQSVPVQPLIGKALLPGLINCHSHAFQRQLRGLGETYQVENKDSFWTWRQEMYSLVESVATREDFYKVTFKCFDEMRRSGITCVAEFHYFHHGIQSTDQFVFDEMVIRAAKDAGVRLVLLSAYYAYGGFGQQPLSTAQQRFETKSVAEYFEQMDRLAAQLDGNDVKRSTDNSACMLGVVAHSLRAVTPEILGQLHRGAAKRGWPFHLHIEEQPREVEECKQAHGNKTPMRVLLDSVQPGRLDRTTAVHCNHSDPTELREFVARGGNVCICPLTEGNLGDGVMCDFAACATAVCLGTDCNARIDMLEEMRWLEYSQRLRNVSRGVCPKAVASARGEATCRSGVELFRMATENGARALGIPAGRIQPGYLADFLLVDLHSSVLDLGINRDQKDLASKLLDALIFGASSAQVVCGTCVSGVWQLEK